MIPEPLANGFCFGESGTDAYPQRLIGTRLSRLDATTVATPGAGVLSTKASR